MTHHYTHGLAEFISNIKYEDIPKEIVDRMKLLVLDTAGAGLLGAALPWSQAMRATMQETEAGGDASIWGTRLSFSAPTAAMVNGTAVHGFEIDDVGAGGHNGSVTMTSALALAQHRDGMSGKELITALVIGIETASRVGRCVGGIPHAGIGFHGPGLMGTFASVASAARTIKLNPGQVVDALGHAGQQAASLMFTHHGGMGKRLLAGQAARAGTFGVLLAANGFTNAPNVFEAEYGGFCSAHTGNQGADKYDLTQLTKDLGTDWHSKGVNFKMWACRVPNHPTLEAIKTLRQQHSIQPEEVEKVKIRLGIGSLQNVGWPYTPTTITSAQLNLQYVASIMLLENDVFFDQFTEEKIKSAKTLDMVSRIEIIHDPSMDQRGAQLDGTPVEITLKDGTVLETLGRVRGGSFEGGSENPVTKEEVVEKFRKMVRPHLSSSEQDQMIDLCERLDSIADATELVELMTIDTLKLTMMSE